MSKEGATPLSNIDPNFTVSRFDAIDQDYEACFNTPKLAGADGIYEARIEVYARDFLASLSRVMQMN